MALRYGDRVKETTSTTGTGTWTLGGAVSGFVAFSAIPGSADGDLVPYRAEQGTDWEVGIGTLGSSKTTLARTVILASSNAGSAVSFGTGPTIVCDLPAEKAMHPTLTEFTASGTFTPKPTSKFFFVVCIGGGGGGGSGSRYAASNNRGGGLGGLGGQINWGFFSAADIGSSVSIGIGVGGGGGAAKTTDGGGNAGTAGNSTTFGSLLAARGGSGGSGGLFGTSGTLSSAAGAFPDVACLWEGALAGARNYTNGSYFLTSGFAITTAPLTQWFHPGAGGTGGSMSIDNSTANASVGGSGIGAGNYNSTEPSGGGSAGTSGGNGGNGSDAPAGAMMLGGKGGGGGGWSTSANAGTGGNGGKGGGGGGGGGAATGFNSGAGGSGGAGLVRVLEW